MPRLCAFFHIAEPVFRQSTRRRVLFAPVDVALTDDTVMQPDLLVARCTDFTVVDGAYVDTGTAAGDETLSLIEPFSIAIQPSSLIA